MQGDKTFKSLLTQKSNGAWVYFWMAHYNDGTSLPQYDPYTLKTHGFTEVDTSKLIKFGWYPFPKKLADKLREERHKNVVSNIFLPKYEVEIDNNKRVIGALTTNYIKNTSYTTCPKCGITDESNRFKKIKIGLSIVTPICPNCGFKAYWLCLKCGKKYSNLKETKKMNCTECGSRVKVRDRHSFKIEPKEERWRVYKLGYQETINGVNKKTIMHIHENGDVELKDK